MNIIIRADRKIGSELIATHIFSGKRIIDRFIDFASSLKANIFVVSDKKIEVNNAKIITASKIKDIKNAIILDLDYVYDERKLKKLIKKGNDIKKSIIKENKEIADLDSFGCLFYRKEWNPISRYYVEPLGEKLAFLIRNSKITPNQVTFFNIIIGLLASSLIYLDTHFSLIIFGVWVRFFHMFDIVDGHLARLKNKLSLFGKWLDGGSDRFLVNLWYIIISSSLYLKSGKTFFLFVGLFILFGSYMYSYLSLTSVAYFRNFKSDYKPLTKIRKNPLAQFILLFIDHDIQLHLLTILAFVNKLEWFILFYAGYLNFIWFMYFLFYLIMYINKKDVKEV